MQSFLEALYEKLIPDHIGNLEESIFVFPTKRASAVFKKIVIQKVAQQKNAFWLPEILSIQQFVSDACNKEVADELTLLAELYPIYLKLLNDKTDFEEFYHFGKTLIKDFDEIDKYMADAQKLFSFISDIKTIDDAFELPEEKMQLLHQFWESINSSKGDKNVYTDRFKAYYQSLDSIYNELNDVLKKRNIAYEGMLYKDLVNQLESQQINFSNRQIVLAGFNALSTSEYRIFRALQLYYDAIIVWDTDDFYLENTLHKAGNHLRENLERLSEKNTFKISTELIQQQKNIQVVEASNDSSQVNYAFELLEAYVKKGQKTVLVLNDESLLNYIIPQLPSHLEDSNITMGYSLGSSSSCQLLFSITQLLKNKRQRDKKTFFYYKDIFRFFENLLIRKLIPEKKRLEFKNSIVHQNLYLVEADLFQEFEDVGSFLIALGAAEISNDILLELFTKIKEKIEAKLKEDYINEYIMLCESIHSISEVMAIFQKQNYQLAFPSFLNTLLQIIGTTKVPFTTNKEANVQIMGFLETRNLDFENVIMLSMNEGYLPTGGKRAVSFIPYLIRSVFEIPTHEDGDEIFSYHFYRLFQRAKNVDLVYLNEGVGVNQNKSRFIEQILSDFSANKLISVSQSVVRAKSKKENSFKIEEIDKAEDVLKKLAAFLEGDRSVSPTALTTYLRDPFLFYLKYIAEIREPNETAEHVDYRIFGTLFHSTMEQLYMPFLDYDGWVHKEDLEKVLSDKLIYKAIEKAFLKENYAVQLEKLEGKNALIKDIITELARKIITADISRCPFKVIALEKKLHAPYSFSKNKEVLLKGVIDRVDLIKEGSKEVVQIIDYKTGAAKIRSPFYKKALLSLEEYFDFYFKNDDYKEGFQGYFYALLYLLCENNNNIKVGFYTVRDIDSGLLKLRNGSIISSEELVVYKRKLNTLLSEVFDNDTPFKLKTKPHKLEQSPYFNLLPTME